MTRRHVIMMHYGNGDMENDVIIIVTSRHCTQTGRRNDRIEWTHYLRRSIRSFGGDHHVRLLHKSDRLQTHIVQKRLD